MGRKKNWRVSRIGSYAIASSIKDATCFSCTTFNILAPIYKRISHKVKWFLKIKHIFLQIVPCVGKFTLVLLRIYLDVLLLYYMWTLIVVLLRTCARIVSKWIKLLWVCWNWILGGAGHQLQRKWCQRILAEEEQKDFGLVTVWKSFYYLPSGFDLIISFENSVVFICYFQISRWYLSWMVCGIV